MRKFAILLMAIMAIPAMSYARLGETAAEIAVRYGKARTSARLLNNMEMSSYRARNFDILVLYADGRSVSESFIRVDKQKFSSEEITALLEDNTIAKTTWKQNGTEWLRSDGLASAALQTNSDRQTFTSKSLAKRSPVSSSVHNQKRAFTPVVLGETRGQIETRYGKAAKTVSSPEFPVKFSSYRVGNLEIVVHFFEEKTVSAIFLKPRNEAFTLAEMQSVLEVNTPAQTTWKDNGMLWLRSDDRAGAISQRLDDQPSFSIFDIAHKVRILAENQTKAFTPAVLGESMEQVEARYGKPVGGISQPLCYYPFGKDMLPYETATLTISAWYEAGKLTVAEFWKKDGMPFSALEIDAALAANSEKMNWDKETVLHANDRWVRGDKSAALLHKKSEKPPKLVLFRCEFADSNRMSIEKTNSVAAFDSPRLGETQAQVETRYGKPLQALDSGPNSSAAIYHGSGIQILICVQDGKVAMASVGKDDNTPFSETEVAAVLKANSSSATTWLKDGAVWLRSDMGVYVGTEKEGGLFKLYAVTSEAFRSRSKSQP